MSDNRFRLAHGGRIDRARSLRFRFNGRDYTGYQGDTLASALLANGVHLLGRSFKYHRPRGVMSAGVEETNALVQLQGTADEPNVRATELALTEGLRARSVNCWPSVRFDAGALNNSLSKVLPAGFYYKTFMWRPWDFYARFIRRMAGLGQAPKQYHADRYEKRFHHCDVLVVGAGPAGLAAALAAGRAGARVVIADDQIEPGGSLLGQRATIDDRPARDWVAATSARLDALPEVMRLANTSVAGYYDHNLLTAVERDPPQPWLRERLWKIRARQTVIASGSFERPLVFANNDRPGIMLATAARSYLYRYAVRAGDNAVVFCNNNSAYESAFDLANGGLRVAAIVDVRAQLDPAIVAAATALNIELLAGHSVVAVTGTRRLRSVTIAPIDRLSDRRAIACDLLCLSGGWNPAVHLHSQSGAKPVFDAHLACFVPGPAAQGERSAGAARGVFGLADGLRDGYAAGTDALVAAGFKAPPESHWVASANYPLAIEAAWELPHDVRREKAFVDFQNDVTVADLRLALRENYRSIEHVKRFTTAGMATDQGKTGNANVIGIVAQQLDVPPDQVGTTTYRPPYAPISFGAIAGMDQAELIIPVRRTAISDWHIEAGAVMSEAGANFRRPFYYPKPGENAQAAIQRAASATRTSVGIYDGSPLGKFELNGSDVKPFLNRIYTNRWDDLVPGQGRFGLMLREDGRLLDDGVCFQLEPNRYLLSAGTGAADTVYAHMERLLQCEWPELKVFITPVTSQWATVCVCGPRAREVVAAAGTDIDLDGRALPFLHLRQGEVAGLAARVARVSYTGELSFEVNVHARHGLDLWKALMTAGAAFDITPVGSETSAVLRIEKGFVSPHSEGDNITNPVDAGMSWVVDMDKGDFIGRRSLLRDRSVGGVRQQVVGLLPGHPEFIPAEGSALVDSTASGAATELLGHVTASCYSPTLQRPIALALLKSGRSRYGDTITISGLQRSVQALVTRSVFVDPKGERMRS